MGEYDRIAVQRDFMRRIREAEQLAQERPQPEPKVEERQVSAPEEQPEPKAPTEPKLPHCEALPGGGCVIYVPRHDDGLDDYYGDIRL